MKKIIQDILNRRCKKWDWIGYIILKDDVPDIAAEIEKKLQQSNVSLTLSFDDQSAIAEIKEYKDLQMLKNTKDEYLCKKYNITGMQLNYLLAVVAAERIKEAEIM